MTISSDTLSRLSSAVEVLATAEGSREHRAKVALSFLSEIDGTEFVGDPAEVHWNYIESVAEAIANGTAEKGLVGRYISAIWLAFSAHCPIQAR